MLDASGKCALTSRRGGRGAEVPGKSLAPYAPKGILNAASGDMRELFLNGSLALEFWPALEQPTLQKCEARLGLRRRASRRRQDAGRHLRRLEPRRLPAVAAPGRGLEVRPVPDPARRQRRGGRPHPGQCRGGQDVPARRTASTRTVILTHLDNAKPRPLSPRYLEVSDIEMHAGAGRVLRHGAGGRGQEGLRQHRRPRQQVTTALARGGTGARRRRPQAQGRPAARPRPAARLAVRRPGDPAGRPS